MSGAGEREVVSKEVGEERGAQGGVDRRSDNATSVDVQREFDAGSPPTGGIRKPAFTEFASANTTTTPHPSMFRGNLTQETPPQGGIRKPAFTEFASAVF